MNAVVFLPLSQGKVAVIDFDDFEKVGRVKWSAHKAGNVFYASRRIFDTNRKQKTLFLHRELLGCGGEIDHINGDGLDNRRENLRPATRAQNLCNQKKQARASSKFKGVCWDKDLNNWRAYIGSNKKRIHLGVFSNEQEAACAYNQAAKKYFGEFARLNFPNEHTP